MAQMQYKTGTVTVTNADATVTGLGTLFVANIAAGAIFKVDGDTATYVVGSITSDTALVLTANYTGTTGGSKTYAIHRDFSVNQGYAMPNKGEAEFPDILREQVIKKIDEDMATKAPLANPHFTGDVGIGTATPGAKLEITSPNNTYPTDKKGSMSLRQLSNSGYGWDWVHDNNINGFLHLHRVENSVSTQVMSFDRSNGNVGIGMTPTVQFELAGSVGQKASGTVWSNPSDECLKNILGPADLKRCYDDVKALLLERYTLKDDCFTLEQAKDRTLTGFRAQTVQAVIPKAVSIVPFSKVKVADGEEEYQEEDIKTKETVTKTRPKYRQDIIEDCLNLDMSQVFMQMFGAVQYLQQKVEALESHLTIPR